MFTSVPTRALLWAGVVGPITFAATFVLLGATRPGYDPVRHFVSLLSLGEGGWIQAANFVISGGLIASFGVGLRRQWTTGRGATWGPRLVSAVGVGLMVSGIFAGDPGLGYPAGAPAGLPTDASWHAGIHYLGAAVVFVGLSIAAFMAARRAAAGRRGPFAGYSLASGLVTLGAWLAPFALAGTGGVVTMAGLWQRIAIVAGWQWLVVIAALELGLAARPIPAPPERTA